MTDVRGRRGHLSRHDEGLSAASSCKGGSQSSSKTRTRPPMRQAMMGSPRNAVDEGDSTERARHGVVELIFTLRKSCPPNEAP